MKQPHDYLDVRPIEDENEDNHWSSDTNRFEDWLLHTINTSENETAVDEFY